MSEWNATGKSGRRSREGEPSGEELRRVNREIASVMREVVADARAPKWERPEQSATTSVRSRGWANPAPLRTPFDGEYAQVAMTRMIDAALPPNEWAQRKHIIAVMNRWAAQASIQERDQAKQELVAKGGDVAALAQMGLVIAQELVAQPDVPMGAQEVVASATSTAATATVTRRRTL